MKKGDEMVLKIADFASGGKSVAKVNGMVVFIPRVVPGDTVLARIRKVRRKFAEADALEVLERAPARTEPRCAHFGICGGCQWQNATYEAQLEQKRKQVVDALERIGGFTGIRVHPVLGSESEYYYRNKMEFSFGAAWIDEEEFGRELETEERTGLGLHPAGTFWKVLDIDECFLQSPASNTILSVVRDFARRNKLPYYSTKTHTGYLRHLVVREGKKTGDLMVNLVTSDYREDLVGNLAHQLLRASPEITTIVNNITVRKSQVAIGEREHIIHGPGYITERLGEKIFRISANSFFQTNTLQAERLFGEVRRIGELRRDDVLYDLYCGTGSIAIFLSDAVGRIVGVETVESAVLDARQNAELNNVSNCRFEIGDLKEKLTKDSSWLEGIPEPTVVVVDPPRSGMHEKVIRKILDWGPERIVYVSCNPATQARDLALLCIENRYQITEVRPVDMFPHTDHVEVVAGLRKSR